MHKCGQNISYEYKVILIFNYIILNCPTLFDIIFIFIIVARIYELCIQVQKYLENMCTYARIKYTIKCIFCIYYSLIVHDKIFTAPLFHYKIRLTTITLRRRVSHQLRCLWGALSIVKLHLKSVAFIARFHTCLLVKIKEMYFPYMINKLNHSFLLYKNERRSSDKGWCALQ